MGRRTFTCAESPAGNAPAVPGQAPFDGRKAFSDFILFVYEAMSVPAAREAAVRPAVRSSIRSGDDDGATLTVSLRHHRRSASPSPSRPRWVRCRISARPPAVIGASSTSWAARCRARVSQGEILPGGADWQIVRPDGTIEVVARYTIRSTFGRPRLRAERGAASGEPGDSRAHGPGGVAAARQLSLPDRAALRDGRSGAQVARAGDLRRRGRTCARPDRDRLPRGSLRKTLRGQRPSRLARTLAQKPGSRGAARLAAAILR